MNKAFYFILVLITAIFFCDNAKATIPNNKSGKRILTELAKAAGAADHRAENIAIQIIRESRQRHFSLKLDQFNNMIKRMEEVIRQVTPSGEKYELEGIEIVLARAQMPLEGQRRMACRSRERAMRWRAEENRKAEESEAAAAMEAAEQKARAIKIAGWYKELKERPRREEAERIAYMSRLAIASGLITEDRDDMRLGALRTSARQILGSLESYMDLIGVPSCRRAQKYMQEGGVIEPDVMPRHIEVYKEVLERVVLADRPWVRPKDLVMEMDEPTIRRTLEDVNTILAKNSRVSRGVRHTAHIDPETNLADALPRG